MKTVALISALLCVLVLPAAADDYSRIPSSIRSQIKAKCVARYPDDYSLQSGCIGNQSDAYLRVHGDEAPVRELDLSGDPSAFDRAQINNSAYLLMAAELCKIHVGRMPAQYRERAIASDRLNAAQVDAFIKGVKADGIRKAKRNRKAFCAEAKKNIPNLVADLQN